MSFLDIFKAAAGNVIKANFGAERKIASLDEWDVTVPPDRTDFDALARQSIAPFHRLFDQRVHRRFRDGDTDYLRGSEREVLRDELRALSQAEGTQLATELARRFKFLQNCRHIIGDPDFAEVFEDHFGLYPEILEIFNSDLRDVLYFACEETDWIFSEAQLAILARSLKGVAGTGSISNHFWDLAGHLARLLDLAPVMGEARHIEQLAALYLDLDAAPNKGKHERDGLPELVRSLARHLGEDPDRHSILRQVRADAEFEERKWQSLLKVSGPRLARFWETLRKHKPYDHHLDAFMKKDPETLRILDISASERGHLLMDCIRTFMFLRLSQGYAFGRDPAAAPGPASFDPADFPDLSRYGLGHQHETQLGKFTEVVVKRKIELTEDELVAAISIQSGNGHSPYSSLRMLQLIGVEAKRTNTVRVRNEIEKLINSIDDLNIRTDHRSVKKYCSAAARRLGDLLGTLNDEISERLDQSVSGQGDTLVVLPGAVPVSEEEETVDPPAVGVPFHDWMPELHAFYEDLSDRRKAFGNHLAFLDRLLARDADAQIENAERRSLYEAACEEYETFEREHCQELFRMSREARQAIDSTRRNLYWAKQKHRHISTSGQYREFLASLRARAGFVNALPEDVKGLWSRFHRHARKLEGKSKPPAAWLQEAREILAPLDANRRMELVLGVLEAFRPVDSGLTQRDYDHRPVNMASDSVPRALIHCSLDLPSEKIGPALSRYAEKHCFKTIPGVGIRDRRLGNSCLWALINRPDGAGVGYLARLLSRIKYPSVKRLINDALDEAAAKAGVTRGELDDLSAPDHGLEEGCLSVALGTQGDVAELTVEGARSVGIGFRKSNGQTTVSVPAHLKDLKGELKSIRLLAKEIEADLQTQALRFERMWLDDRSWTVSQWHERIVGHPLLSLVACRLIWSVGPPGREVAGTLVDGRLVDIDGRDIRREPQDVVRLWHPIGEPGEVVDAWRQRLAGLGIAQPFRQAHREVYLLTDGERDAGVYSNRFAGHIVKQHQMMTLARLNGWSVTHRIWADVPNNEPTRIVLKPYGIAAEFWTRGAGGDDPPVTESQAYIYISTDQVRFYRLPSEADRAGAGASGKGEPACRDEAMRLADVPPLIFSEIMRHCDLFVSVASVAQDPAWLDGGRGGEHPNAWHSSEGARYWQSAALGDLSMLAKTRMETLKQVAPGLTISDRLSFDGSFLEVRGNRHGYRIHVASGSVLMLPSLTHLCLLPTPSSKALADLSLPFEDDRMLARILSTAFMLVEDHKIADQMILRQLPGSARESGNAS